MDFGVRPRDKTPKSGVAHCKLSLSQETRMSKPKIKSVLICFFFLTVRRSSTRNLCHQDKLSTFYREVLERLRKRGACVRPGIARTWVLHHDNAPCHTAVSINEFWQKRAFLWFLSPPIRLISVTSFYSPGPIRLISVTSFYSPGSKPT